MHQNPPKAPNGLRAKGKMKVFRLEPALDRGTILNRSGFGPGQEIGQELPG